MAEKVTKEEEKEMAKISAKYGLLSALIVLVISIGLTSWQADGNATKEELKKKADVEYVDKRCLETKQEIESKIADMKDVLGDIKEQNRIANQDIKVILKEMPRR